MRKYKWDLEIKKRGAKIDVYLRISELQVRLLFTMVTVLNQHQVPVYTLRHSKKERLGALADEVGLEYMKALIVIIYQALLKSYTNSHSCYVFEAIIVDELPVSKNVGAVYPHPQHNPVLREYVINPTIENKIKL